MKWRMIVQVQTLKMHFSSPLHLGDLGIGLENVGVFAHSDTLFSALCHAYADLFGEAETKDMLGAFADGEPPFRLSSAFPFVGDTYFFPKPALPPPDFTNAETRTEHAKDVKSASFVPQEIFDQWIRG